MYFTAPLRASSSDKIDDGSIVPERSFSSAFAQPTARTFHLTRPSDFPTIIILARHTYYHRTRRSSILIGCLIIIIIINKNTNNNHLSLDSFGRINNRRLNARACATIKQPVVIKLMILRYF